MTNQDTHVSVHAGQSNETEISRSELRYGDIILIETQNGQYSIRVLKNDQFLVSGGWFDQNRISPIKISIAGCTLGGTTLNENVIAVCGMRTEFGNQVRTSQVRKIRLVASNGRNIEGKDSIQENEGCS